MEASRKEDFFLKFATMAEFRQAIEHKEQTPGVFLRYTRPISVGTRVSIMVEVKERNRSFFFDGEVLWRRLRSGGPRLPPGVFVRMTKQDMTRLDASIRYLTDSGAEERRRQPRYPIKLSGLYATSKGEFQCQTLDLSRGGAFVRCMGPLLIIGDVFPLVLYPEEEGGKGVVISVRVAWIEFVEERRGMGVAFVDSKSHLKKIFRVLDNYEINQKRLWNTDVE